MKIDISIIVPIYNVEKYLKKCVQSILNQSFKNFELILVNDGSLDKCGRICDEYAKKDERIKVIHKVNGGLSSARNAGLNIASGEYIGFVDSDDYLDERMYEVLINSIRKTNSDMVICDYYIDYENEKDISKEYDINVIVKEFDNISALKELYRENGVKFVVAWNKIYKRELFDELRYENGRIHEDEILAHKLLYKCNKITYIPIKLYHYLQRENSIMNTRNNIKRLDIIYAYDERMKFFKEINKLELLKKTEYCYIVRFFEEYKKNNGDKKETDILRKSMKKNIWSVLKNDRFIFKEKVVWILFLINTKLYDKYIVMKG